MPPAVSRGILTELNVLLPLLSALLLLLLLVASLLAWRIVKRRRKGERTWLGLGGSWAEWERVGPMAGVVT